MTTSTDETTFTDDDGVEVFLRRWQPDGDARGAVIVAHGMSEHSGRYGRFAGALTEDAWAVYALDHRGHGRTADATGRGHTGPRGGDGLLGALGTLVTRAEEETGGPVVLFGHSMGAILSQVYAERHGEGLGALVLSGSTGPLAGSTELLAGLDQVVAAGGSDEPVDMLGGFNAPFEPARTRYDWLSRDPAEVDAYIADPYCGDNLPMTQGFIAEIFRLGVEGMTAEGVARIPAGLPILLLTGEQDPASGMAAQVRALEDMLRDHVEQVTARYYPDARHELLNETNRDEVTADVIEWLDQTLPRSR